MARGRPFAHAAPTREADLPVKFHAENTPALPASRKGQSGKVLLCRQQDYPAASVDHFCIAVLRRAKIQYLLSRKGADTPEMIGFVEKDIDKVLGLFKELNSATHGPAGKFEFAKLRTIRKRVEGGIMFLATLAA
jgi:hypothetical protein